MNIVGLRFILMNYYLICLKNNKGRVHQAVVTQLHPISNSVSVEWCERNETKGKEIELEALYALNTTFFVI